MRLKGRWPYDSSKTPSVDGDVRVAARCGRGSQAAGEPCVAAVAADIEGLGLTVRERAGVGVADFALVQLFDAR